MSDHYLTRAEQAAYLNERGIPITKTTLQKMATTGGGPRYVIFGNKALSTPEWLDEWVVEKMSAPRRSTSDQTSADGQAAQRSAARFPSRLGLGGGGKALSLPPWRLLPHGP